MSIASRFLAEINGLPKRKSGVVRHRGLRLPMLEVIRR